ncbi:MAG: UDP-N-acetylmuramate dehydrogenase [Candidatus Omnitrophota bacterium]|nr:MAG: UDP-N-acetylmuramate dehydrogenase [Candidatus Omnitrophota bacterium]
MVVIEDKQRLILKRNCSLRDYTTIKIGGRANSLFIVSDSRHLSKIVKDYKDSFYLLGAGSNILVSDGHLNKPVVKLGEGFNYIKEESSVVEVGAATPLSRLLNYMLKNNLAGAENLAGIPASIGGLLVMNASSFGTEASSLVEKVKVMDKQGAVSVLGTDKLNFFYRGSTLRDYVILAGWFRFEKGSQLKNKVKTILGVRYRRGEFDYPSCGCIFKNPPNAFSGELIEGCGLKGTPRNNAAISDKHANFIINLGGASFNDADYLIKLIKDRVYKKYNVVLEEEVRRWQ